MTAAENSQSAAKSTSNQSAGKGHPSIDISGLCVLKENQEQNMQNHEDRKQHAEEQMNESELQELLQYPPSPLTTLPSIRSSVEADDPAANTATKPEEHATEAKSTGASLSDMDIESSSCVDPDTETMAPCAEPSSIELLGCSRLLCDSTMVQSRIAITPLIIVDASYSCLTAMESHALFQLR
jgi:hypothetical protein